MISKENISFELIVENMVLAADKALDSMSTPLEDQDEETVKQRIRNMLLDADKDDVIKFYENRIPYVGLYNCLIEGMLGSILKGEYDDEYHTLIIGDPDETIFNLNLLATSIESIWEDYHDTVEEGDDPNNDEDIEAYFDSLNSMDVIHIAQALSWVALDAERDLLHFDLMMPKIATVLISELSTDVADMVIDLAIDIHKTSAERYTAAHTNGIAAMALSYRKCYQGA